MKKQELFTPLMSPPSTWELGAFDVEGEGGENGFVSAVALTPSSSEYFTDRHHLVKYLTSHRHRSYSFYSHNLTYDFGVIMPDLNPKVTALTVKGRVFKVIFDDGNKDRVYLRDSLGMWYGQPLSAIGKTIGLVKYETPPSLRAEHGEAEEWYCEAHHRLWCIECYNRRDAEIVLKAMKLYQDTLSLLGSDLGNTLASTAMKLFRRRFLKNEYYKPHPYRNAFAREGYYGGRVEPYMKGTFSSLNLYDYHSLYPSVMYANNFPNPNSLVGPICNPPLSVIWDYEGFSKVRIECPPMNIPVLPFRVEGNLYFPTGELYGTWAHCELRYAIKHGYKLKEVKYSLYSTSVCCPFVDYVQTLYDLRCNAKRQGDATELVYKCMLNSLYGKFGQRNDSGLRKLCLVEDIFHDDSWEGYEEMWVGDKLYIGKTIPTSNEPAFVNLLWASYITAYARIKLYEAMEQTDFNPYYVDTDSVFTRLSLATQDTLGGLDVKLFNVGVSLYAPKAYILNPETQNPIAVCKGVPTDFRYKYLTEGIATYLKPLGVYEGVARKDYPSRWVEITKHSIWDKEKREFYHTPGMAKGIYYSHPWDVNHLP
jgi:hypothetical protein